MILDSSAVHPRRRGELVSYSHSHCLPTGSSPQARGTRHTGQRERLTIRFIPAGAGNSIAAPSSAWAPEVHPRRRGELGEDSRQRQIWYGSSPQARGTHRRACSSAYRDRFIPAGAGNSAGFSTTRRVITVHPRRRGELAVVYRHPQNAIGSSPRARGTLGLILLNFVAIRFIPAGAGNTLQRTGRLQWTAVHPRGRGEHSQPAPSTFQKTGSSPRARGTPAAIHRRVEPQRFIPAGAGNTANWLAQDSDGTVHPRGRGEHVIAMAFKVGLAGSSPRARGTRSKIGSKGARRRFIPAGAGNTRPRSPRSSPLPVHPRGRGEHGVLIPIA